jgi:myo-inositol-1(or 4)-monophosphatase
MALETVMNSENINARFAFAHALAREAGAFALGFFQRRDELEITHKGMQDLVSQADVEVELLIRRRLAEAYPGDGFLGEETGGAGFAPGQGVWVVDPIDGTQPFVNGSPGWCVSIGFITDLHVRFGVVFAPVRDELFAGCEGLPATLNGRVIKPRAADSLKDGIISIGHSPKSDTRLFLNLFGRLIHAGAMYYREGSGALALCYVACGRLIGFIEIHIKPWDVLGAIAVLRSAGLRVNDFLADDGLRKGNVLIAGTEGVYVELAGIWAAVQRGA